MASFGILLMAIATGMFFVMLPKNGSANRFATAPVLEMIVPLVIVIGFAIGIVFTIRAI